MNGTDDRPSDRLRSLDEAFLPALGRLLRAVGRAVGKPVARLTVIEERIAGGAVFRLLWPRRQMLLLVIAVLVFAASFAHFQRYPDARAAAEQEAGDRGVAAVDEDPRVVGGFTIGPAIGEDVESYVGARQEALEDASGHDVRVAAVSFDSYLDAEEVAARIGDLRVIAAQFRVPLEGESPITVRIDGDIAETISAAIGAERDRIAAEEEEFRRLAESGTVADPEFQELYETEQERFAHTRNLLDGGAGTVFALLVEAPVDDLRSVATTAGVRLVDIAPIGADPASIVFYGMLPDAGGEVTFGRLG